MTEPQFHHVSQLLSLHDNEFVDAAYLTLLGRPADESGRNYYVGRLRSGSGRLQVLAELNRSPEAQLHDARLEGLGELLGEHERARKLRLLAPIRRGSEPHFHRLENDLGRTHRAVERLAPQVNHCVVRLDELRNDMDRLSGMFDVGQGPAKLAWREARVHEVGAEAVAGLTRSAQSLLCDLGVFSPLPQERS